MSTWPSVEFTSSGTSGLYMGVTSKARHSITWVWQDRHGSVHHGCGNIGMQVHSLGVEIQVFQYLTWV